MPSSASATPTLDADVAEGVEDQKEDTDGSLIDAPPLLLEDVDDVEMEDAPIPSSASATLTSDARCAEPPMTPREEGAVAAPVTGGLPLPLPLPPARASRDAALLASRERYSSSIVVMFWRSARGGRRSSTSD